MKNSIGESTTITISLMVTLCACVFFIAVLYASDQAKGAQISEIKMSQREIMEKVIKQNEEMIDRLGRIEERIKYLK